MPTLSTSPTAPTAPAPPESRVATPVPAQPAEVKPDPAVTMVPPGFTDADALNMVIENFSANHGRLPRDLNELVTTKAIPRLPEPPAGKKFVLEGSRVKVVPR